MNENPLPDLIYRIIQKQRERNPERPALIGVSGAQGSGKTTVCQLLVAANAPRFAQFSIDDVYLDHVQRAELAARTHPLFVTRGPPGTHDIALARATIEALSHLPPPLEGEGARGWGEASGAAVSTLTPAPLPSRERGVGVSIPRFDKIKDVMKPREDWPVFHGRPEAILVDGWCLGALPVPSSPPLNAVEEQDTNDVWRETQNEFLRTNYADWFATFDAIIYLRAPSWDIVRRWRGQQEVTLRGRALTSAEEAWIDRFIMHYERITRSMMEGNHTATRVVEINERRQPT